MPIETFDVDRARNALSDFAAGTITVEELEAGLGGRFQLHPELPSRYQINGPLPSVRLTREHVWGILARALRNDLDAAAVARWAEVVLVLDGSSVLSGPTAEPCYGLDPPGPDQGALSRIVWQVYTASAWDKLSEAKLHAWLDELTGDAA